MITAKIICDSINPAGVRLTTFELTYPRFIHAEFMTHRAISRNAASSRAIPIEKMIAAVKENPATPEFWAENQSGMQASKELRHHAKNTAEFRWRFGSEEAVELASKLAKDGLHKAIANRVLEPFSHITVVATADNFGWANLFALRAHPMAQQEFQVLAFRMLARYIEHGRADQEKIQVNWGDWHMPFIRAEDVEEEQDLYTLAKISIARCARVSYLTHDGVRDHGKDLELFHRLFNGKPPHSSAFEHVAQAVQYPDKRESSRRASNFDWSWQQYRKLVAGETTRELDLFAVLNTKPDWITL